MTGRDREMGELGLLRIERPFRKRPLGRFDSFVPRAPPPEQLLYDGIYGRTRYRFHRAGATSSIPVPPTSKNNSLDAIPSDTRLAGRGPLAENGAYSTHLGIYL